MIAAGTRHRPAVVQERLPQPDSHLHHPRHIAFVVPATIVVCRGVPSEQHGHRPSRVLPHRAHRIRRQRPEHGPQVLPVQARVIQHNQVRENSRHRVPSTPVENSRIACATTSHRAEHVLPRDHRVERGEVGIPPSGSVPGGQRSQEGRKVLQHVQPYGLVGIAQEGPFEGREELGVVGRGVGAEHVRHGVDAAGEASLHGKGRAGGGTGRELGVRDGSVHARCAAAPALCAPPLADRAVVRAVRIGAAAPLPDQIQEASFQPVPLPILPAEQQYDRRQAVRAVHPHLGVGRIFPRPTGCHGHEGYQERGADGLQILGIRPAGHQWGIGRGLGARSLLGGLVGDASRAMRDYAGEGQSVGSRFEEEFRQHRPRRRGRPQRRMQRVVRCVPRAIIGG
mmetsp:Transcript_8802/g.21369  ORF Transcript_8802/g.21369 Transcript_8802/m.21369 type:complete len:396 (-) Transcript_8802:2154-3341(-)